MRALRGFPTNLGSLEDILHGLGNLGSDTIALNNADRVVALVCTLLSVFAATMCACSLGLRDFRLGRAFTWPSQSQGQHGQLEGYMTYVAVLLSSELCDPLLRRVVSLVLAFRRIVSDSARTATTRAIGAVLTWKDKDAAARGAAAKHWRRTGAATARRASIMKRYEGGGRGRWQKLRDIQRFLSAQKEAVECGFVFLVQRLNGLKVAKKVRSDRIGNMEH